LQKDYGSSSQGYQKGIQVIFDVMKNFRFFLITTFVCVVCLSACQSNNYLSAFTTVKGVRVETLLPTDSFFVFKVGTSDENQIKSLDGIIKKFPGVEMGFLRDKIVSEIDSQMLDSGLSFADDIIPVLGDKPQAIVAVAGQIENDQTPDIVIALQVSDEQKGNAFLEKLISTGFQKQTYKTFDIYVDGGSRAYIVLYNDLLLITNRIALVQSGLDRANAAENTFLQDGVYQKGLAKAHDALGFFYFDLQRYFAMTQAQESGFLKGMQAEVFSIYAQDEGFRFGVSAYGDEKLMKESKMNFLSLSLESAYLYKNISAENLIFYTEGYDLKNLIEFESEIYKGVAGFDSFSSGVAAAISGLGIDVQKDLYVFMG
jgi:hypothetical protein